MFDYLFFFGVRVDTELRDRDLVLALLHLDRYFGLSNAQLYDNSFFGLAELRR